INTLVMAQSIGVLHRDISAGNITTLDNQASIIDWGFAKLIPREIVGTNLDELARAWDFDGQQVLQNEDEHDGLIGTGDYMSIPVLIGARNRGVVKDMESALYVLLDAARA
ncbi:hypothetical protein H4R19_005427, partial [Coemansia spiralis]